MSKSGFILLAAMAALSAHCLPALAQQARDNAAPPQLEKLEEVTPPKRNLARDVRDAASASKAPAKPAASGTQITQTREQGVVTEVQVKSGNSKYYLKPNTQPGTVPGDAQSSTTRPAQWQIMQFDWKREQDRKAAATQAASVPAPPDAPAASAAPAKK